MNARVLAESGWPCPTGEEMRAIDRSAIEQLGIPGRVLMETAGRAVALAIACHHPGVRRPLVVCGAGNNGGDGFVVARVLADRDDRVRPRVALLGASDRYSDEARANLELLSSCDVEVVVPERGKQLGALLAESDLAVDALFGVGLSRRVEGSLSEALEALAGCACPCVAVDLPSGLSSDTGEALGPEFEADLIVTLGLPKLGLAVRPLAAPILVADIGLPWSATLGSGVRQWVWSAAAARLHLPRRPLAAHKGTFGHVLVVGGSEGKTGAPCLTAEGALRTGAGLVTAAAPRSLAAIYEAKLTEAMSLVVDDGGSGRFDSRAARDLVREAAARDALVVGPGLGRHPDTVALVESLLASVRAPTVVDADGLNAFAGNPEGLRGPGSRVVTPHPGEMSRLLGRSSTQVQGDRVGAARELAGRSGAVVILKGARSLVAAPDGELRINPTGGPGLASGGSGDVLAGMVGALLAGGLPSFDAASLAAYLHGLAAESLGRVGVLASEVAARVPRVWAALAQGTDEPDPPADESLRRFP